ncbi:glycosyltransferase family A protein [Gemmatimonas phototrophica]|uniref:glycosyltransferase family 2 protein n=1 Tax=Gemmatimonas phototrophica TaxID=1379270 RepID=UPI000946208B
MVPLYNKAAYIDRCLTSILGQTGVNFEVLVVDDGSSDNGASLVLEHRDPRIRLIRQENAGPGRARNRGAEEARAPYLAFLDADDVWHSNFLSESLAFVRVHPTVAALTWGLQLEPRGVTTERQWKGSGIPEGPFRAGPNTSAAVIVSMLTVMLPSCTVHERRSFLAAGGFYDKNRCLFSEDAYLYLRLLMQHSVAFQPRPLAIRYEDASELAVQRDGMRQVEPFLLDPESIYRDTPVPMRHLLGAVLTRRALKTATVCGYWGKSAMARMLVKRFMQPQDIIARYGISALMSCVGVTAILGWTHRNVLQSLLPSGERV